MTNYFTTYEFQGGKEGGVGAPHGGATCLALLADVEARLLEQRRVSRFELLGQHERTFTAFVASHSAQFEDCFRGGDRRDQRQVALAASEQTAKLRAKGSHLATLLHLHSGR